MKQVEVGTEPAEVGRARRWVRAQLVGGRRRPAPGQTDTLVLLVSELVTNAVVHTGRPAVLRLAVRERRASRRLAVRLEVADTSNREPRRRQAAGEDTDGRGLELVEVLADRWGWQREGSGKRVWCELDCVVHESVGAGRKVPATS